jgi:hypothetical protein
VRCCNALTLVGLMICIQLGFVEAGPTYIEAERMLSK